MWNVVPSGGTDKHMASSSIVREVRAECVGEDTGGRIGVVVGPG